MSKHTSNGCGGPCGANRRAVNPTKQTNQGFLIDLGFFLTYATLGALTWSPWSGGEKTQLQYKDVLGHLTNMEPHGWHGPLKDCPFLTQGR